MSSDQEKGYKKLSQKPMTEGGSSENAEGTKGCS